MGLYNELACEAGSFSCCCLNPTGVFSQRFEALFPCPGALGCAVCFAPPQFLPVYLCANVGPQAPPAAASLGPPATALPSVLSGPPTGLDECFFINSLVVRLPYSSIFWQFWLLFVFIFVVVLLLVVQGGKVYLPMHPSWPEAHISGFNM